MKEPPIRARSALYLDRVERTNLDDMAIESASRVSVHRRAFVLLALSLMLVGCAHSASSTVSTSTAGAATSRRSERGMTTASALADAAVALAGTWDCQGSVSGPEGPSPSRVSLEVTLALDDAWLRSDFAVVSGRYPYAFSSYRTYEASSGEWVNLIVDNMSGHTVSRSTNGIDWAGESSTPMGRMSIRDTETAVSPDRVDLIGQYSLDGGSTWSTGYELSCAR